MEKDKTRNRKIIKHGEKNEAAAPHAEFFTLRGRKAEEVEPYFYAGKNLKKPRKTTKKRAK